MRYLGIDYGAKRVGIAISDDGGVFAFPLADVPNDQGLVERVLVLVNEKGVGEVVLGDTRTTQGMANTATAAAEKFADNLEKAGIVVRLQHELWSSIEANRYQAAGDAKSDAAAAAIILQRYLDSIRETISTPDA